MNDALISGLLGAIMGGSSSIEKSIAEEEAAKRKEEEEKRREERALTLAERKADAEQKRKLTLEAEERKRVAGMMGPETRMTPGANPMEPEGIVESKIPIEERLQAGMQKAMSEGDTKTAKALLDQFQGIEEVKRKAAEEARKGEPKKEEPSAEFKTRMATIQAAYPGKKDEGGNPIDKEDYDKYVRAEFGKLAAKEAYIRPERPTGVAGGERPPTPSQIATADRAISRALPSLAKTKDISGKDVVDQQMLSYYRSAVNEIKKSDPNAVFDINGTLETAQAKVSAAEERAKQKAASEWRAMSDADKKASGITSEKAYVRKNYKSYISNYLGGAAEEERPDPLGLRTR